MSPGDVPAEDPNDGYLFRDHAAQATESAAVGRPRRPVRGRQRRPAAAARQQGVDQGGDGTEPPGRSGRRRGVLHHVRLRWRLLREDPQRHEAESVAA